MKNEIKLKDAIYILLISLVGIMILVNLIQVFHTVS